MRVRTLMLWGLAMAFGLIVMNQLLNESMERQRVRTDAVQLAIGHASRDAASLLVLTQDYLLHGSTRAQRQWRAVQAELVQTLAGIDGEQAGLGDSLGALTEVTRNLTPLFTALEAATGADRSAADPERVEMLSAHLVAETRRISDGAFDLERRLIDLRRERQRFTHLLSLAANIAFGLLQLGLIAIVLRRVLRPMRELQAAAGRIAQGDLTARSAYRASDEFGSLSQGFDAMAQALQDREASLEATRRDLRTVLDAVPSMIGYWDHRLVNRVANRAYSTWFGVDPEALRGRTLRDLLSPALFEANRPHIEAALRGEPQTFERSIPRPDGQGVRHSLAHYLPDVVNGEVQGFYVVVHDISELTEGRTRLAHALRQNEDLLASIRTHTLFAAMDAAGHITDVNDALCALSGHPREALLGQTLQALQPRLADGDFEDTVWAAVRAGRAWQGEVCHRARDGSEFWTQSLIAPVLGADGQVQRVVAMLTDITTQRRLSLALQMANDRFELAATAAGFGVWEYDIVAGTLLWDDRMYALYGRDRASGLQPYALWADSVHPDDKAESERALGDAIAGLREFEQDFRIVRPHGEVRQLRAMARTVRDEQGKPLRMIGVNSDITERLRTEAALRANDSLLRRVGRLANVGGWSVDLATNRLHWTEQTRVIHEVPDDFEPEVETAIEFYAPESRAPITEALDRAMRLGEPWDLELRLITHTGRSIWVRAMGEVEFGDAGHPQRLVGAFQDITERRRMDDLLRAATAAAEAASAAKSAFLANMSHEIRTPLNAIIGVTHLLGDTPLDGDQRRLISQAQLAGRSLLGIINDVLDLAKIEAGEMALDEAAYEPAALLRELEALYAPQARAKGLDFAIETDPAMPQWLVGDRARLQQMLTNLVTNAIKFTGQGEVRLRLRLAEAGGDRCRVTGSVQDTGIGIAPDVQSNLFAPFVQADASTTRRFGGSGLGLSIVKRIATIMGGEVGVRSQIGQGSEFWFTVPQRIPTGDQIGRASETAADTLEVAVVDDSSVDRLGLVTQVRALGWKALALDAGEALLETMTSRLNEGQRLPDVLLLDWRMPGMDGLETLAALTRRMGSDQVPAALVVSASERRQVAALDQNHLADHILTKPVAASVLFNAVNQSMARRFGSTDKVMQSTHVEAADALWLAGVRVLLVDDSDINLDVARRLLEHKGATVRACAGAAEALAVLREAPDAIDAVLMDVQMPGMDGLEATRRLRRDLGLTRLPVVALTAGALMEERRRAMDAGMNEFLTKPLDPGQLVRTLRRVVEAYRGALIPVTGTASPANLLADWPTIEGIDTADVASRLGGDADLFGVMLARFLREYGDLAVPLPPPGPGGTDPRATPARLHKLKGSAGMLGARDVQRLAADAETALRESPSAALAPLARLSTALAQLATASHAFLQAPDATLGEPAAPPATPEDLSALAELLRRRDLSARDWLRPLVPGLRSRLGAETTDRLVRLVDDLEYEQALNLLPATAGDTTGP